MVSITAKYIPGKKTILTEQLSRLDEIFLMEWSFLPQAFDIIREFGHPLMDLFATRADMKFPIYVSTIPDAMTWKGDAFQHQQNDLSICAFPPYVHLRQVLSKVMLSCSLSLILMAPFWPQRE